MKKKMNVFAAMLVCAGLLCGTVFAAEDMPTGTVQEPAVYTLSLSDAIERASKDHPQLIANEAEQESNRINLDAQQRTKRKYEKFTPSTSNYDVMYIKKGYYVHTYEMMMRLNEKKEQQIRSKIAYDVTQSYFNYKLACSLRDIAANAYDLALENYNNVKTRFDLGMIAELDLKNAQLSVDQCRNTLSSYERKCGLAKENLKFNLQLEDKECDFILTDDISCGEFSADLEKDLAAAYENRYDVNALKESYLLSEEYFEYTKPLSSATAKYQTAYSDYVTKGYEYNNNKKLIGLSVKNTYNSVLDAKDTLATAEKSTEIAKQTYEINKVKFENGMITNSDLTKSLNDYLSSNISLENAKLTYKLAVEKYAYEISIGLGQ